MTISFYLPLWYLATWLAAPALYPLLRRLDLEPALAWTGSRTISLVVAATAAWGAAHLGMSPWPLAGIALLAAGLLLSVKHLRLDAPFAGRIARAELVFLAAFAAILLLRLQTPEIRGTEKPLDFGILNTLLGARAFPPPDFWLAGETLNYYYFGLMPWVIPARLTGIPTEYVYNLAVASVGASVFSMAWAVASRLGAAAPMALLGAFLCTFSGTLDGVRQLAVTRDPGGIDTWASSRQVTGTITEYPLFTTWLGDLHAHFTSAPMLLAALLLALVAFGSGTPRYGLALLAVLTAAAAMANPWLAPTLAALVAILAACAAVRGREDRHGALFATASAALALAAAAWLAYPFFSRFEPPANGLEFARTQTTPGALFLYAGIVLVPLAAGLFRLAARAADDRRLGVTGLWGASALAVAVAAASGRPLLVVLLALAALAAWTASCARDPAPRCAVWIAVLGLGLFAVPEIVIVRDDYGDAFRRANTVFKTYVQGWMLIAVALPAIVCNAFPSNAARRVVCAALLVASLPHALALVGAGLDREPGLDGLRWMAAGDRAVVAFVRDRAPRGALLEAPGRAYEDAGRIAAATGTPGYLGWRRHERFWRGAGVEPELERRWRVADDLYSAGDVDRVRRLAARENIALVVIGSVERSRYPAMALDAIEAAGDVVLSSNEARVVQF